MKKTFLATIVALFALFAVMSFVSADGMGDFTHSDSFSVTVDGMKDGPFGIEAGETIPIKVAFTAITDASDVKMRVWIDGYRSDIKDSTGRFELVEGSSYSRKFSLTVPSDIDPTEDYSLIVRLSDKTGSDEYEYTLKIQRESYRLDVLNVEVDNEVIAGNTLAVDVVLKNRGMHNLEDLFVKVKIADLGIEKRVYFGDLAPLDDCEYDEDFADRGDEYDHYEDCDGNREDSVYKRVYLSIPSNARTGVYSLEVEAYNDDSLDTTKKSVVVKGSEDMSDVLSGTNAKSLNFGEEVSFDLVLVNTGNTMKVYSLTPESADGLIITVDSIVTVASDSSKTVKVRVKATDSAKEGTQNIAINVESDGELVKQAVFSANVEKQGKASRNSVVVLTIVLAIVFVVLLVILIVLLTRKPSAVESEETSYY